MDENDVFSLRSRWIQLLHATMNNSRILTHSSMLFFLSHPECRNFFNILFETGTSAHLHVESEKLGN